MSVVTTPAFIWYPGAFPALAWLQIIITVMAVLIVDMTYSSIRRWYFAKPLDILIEQDRGYLNDVKSKPRAIRDGMKVLRQTGTLMVSPVPKSIGAIRRAANRRLRSQNSSVETNIRKESATAPENAGDLDDREIGPVRPAFVYDGAEGTSDGPQMADETSSASGSSDGVPQRRSLSELAEGSSRMKMSKHSSHAKE
mmetsp:Transcript_17407/g.34188  ORF Transcript_17407/g.34188 Transcript_17407/m.34188 type:complete len:197 (+) Transcript_17407:4077-4667(+)